MNINEFLFGNKPKENAKNEANSFKTLKFNKFLLEDSVLFKVFKLVFNYNYYPFKNKEKTMNQIANGVFNDLTNEDFFIGSRSNGTNLNNEDTSNIFANAFWMYSVLRWLSAFKYALENNYEKMVDLDGVYSNTTLTKEEKEKRLKEEHLQFLARTCLMFKNIISLQDTFLIKEVAFCQQSEKFLLDDFLENGVLYKDTKSKIESEKGFLINREHLQLYVAMFLRLLERYFNIAFSTKKIQTHVLQMLNDTINNLQNKVKNSIENNDEDALLEIKELQRTIKRSASSKVGYFAISVPSIKPDENALIDKFLKSIKNDDFLLDYFKNSNDFKLLDDVCYNSIATILLNEANYEIINNFEFSDLADLKAFHLDEHYKKMEKSGYSALNETSRQMYYFFNYKIEYDEDDESAGWIEKVSGNWLANAFIFKQPANEFIADVRSSIVNEHLNRAGSALAWIENNNNQPGFNYNDKLFLLYSPISKNDPERGFCYKLDLTNQETKKQLLELNKSYINLYRFCVIKFLNDNNLSLVLENEELLPKKWKTNTYINKNTNFKR